MKHLLFLLLTIIPVELLANAVDASRILNHSRLQQAVRFNTPPSGYIDLSYCDSVKNVGNLPVDRKTYRLSYDDNFAFNPETGELSTISERHLLESRNVGKATVLATNPVTVIVSSSPNSPYLKYQVMASSHQRTNVRIYLCDWKKAVYLWR